MKSHVILTIVTAQTSTVKHAQKGKIMAKQAFGWKIAFETDSYRIALPSMFAQEPVSDDEVKQYLKLMTELLNIDYLADEIYHLIFIAVNTDDKEPLAIEPLNPFVFWPRKPEICGAKNIAKYRVQKGGEK